MQIDANLITGLELGAVGASILWLPLMVLLMMKAYKAGMDFAMEKVEEHVKREMDGRQTELVRRMKDRDPKDSIGE